LVAACCCGYSEFPFRSSFCSRCSGAEAPYHRARETLSASAVAATPGLQRNARQRARIALRLLPLRGLGRGPREGATAWTGPVGDNARKGAAKKRSQLATKTMGKKTFTKRNKEGSQFMAQKKKTKVKTKFKRVRKER
jgi:hypothetical protein